VNGHSTGQRSTPVSACERFVIDQRIVVEPACGAALAAAYEKVAEIEIFRSILIIVCGGAATSIEQLRQWSNIKI
jgi:L-serine/L-threonine ammonia-lyase